MARDGMLRIYSKTRGIQQPKMHIIKPLFHPLQENALGHQRNWFSTPVFIQIALLPHWTARDLCINVKGYHSFGSDDTYSSSKFTENRLEMLVSKQLSTNVCNKISWSSIASYVSSFSIRSNEWKNWIICNHAPQSIPVRWTALPNLGFVTTLWLLVPR
jgi:hypothetical protein